MTTFCPNCGSDFVDDPGMRSAEGRRAYLRSRLPELTALIAALTAERQSLQAESDSITYPVLSLPTEITTEVFKSCLPTDSLPHPSPSTAPLLLTQICGQWRHIALHTHDLWRSLNFAGDASVEMLRLWLSRSGDLPLEYTLSCQDPTQAGAFVEASMLHSHHWQDISFEIPLAAFLKLDMHNQSLTMLRRISLHLCRVTDEVAEDPIILQNAPLLRDVRIFTLPDLKFRVPWPQLTTLILCNKVDLMEYLSLLRQCSQLVHLVVSVRRFPTAAADASPIALPLLKTLTSLSGKDSILSYFTLPRLERLEVAAKDPSVLSSFIRRSACTLHFLRLWVQITAFDTLDLYLRAAPSSITELQLDDTEYLQRCCNVLRQVDVLPHLTSLHIRFFPIVLDEDYEAVVAMLRARRQSSSSRVVLHSFVLETALRPDHMRR